MNESLSQNEIDALFGSGGGEPGEDPSKAEIQVYDFGRPARISKERKRSLVAIYDVLSKGLEGWLTARCRDRVELSVESVEIMSFGEFTLALVPPCASFLVDINGKSGAQAVVDFGSELAFFLVDRFLGGGGPPTVPQRGLTPLERMVVRISAERALSHLSEAWRDYVALDLEVAGFESIPEMIQAANREDPMVVANVQASFADTTSAVMLSLPFQVLEKFFTGDATRRTHEVEGSPAERDAYRRRIETSLLASGVEVAARFPTLRVPMGRLAALKAGSTLSTGLAPDSGLEILVDGQRRFFGAAGRSSQQIAVRVTGEVPPEARATSHKTGVER